MPAAHTERTERGDDNTLRPSKPFAGRNPGSWSFAERASHAEHASSSVISSSRGGARWSLWQTSPVADHEAIPAVGVAAARPDVNGHLLVPVDEPVAPLLPAQHAAAGAPAGSLVDF